MGVLFFLDEVGSLVKFLFGIFFISICFYIEVYRYGCLFKYS